MGIQALNQNTARALGASQVLTDPTCVVKELIDNAIDARANSITVDISSNTLDVIQVRDNGHGVAPADRQLIAKQHCTSKITNEDDLKAIGGSFLGFRGVALASAAELSGTLQIHTRIQGEPVATRMDIDRSGNVIDETRVSLPFGTLVRVTDFLGPCPVRKRLALRNAPDSLRKLKRMLQAYAFARPNVRLSLRILKAENGNRDWMFAPETGEDVKNVAIKIVGVPCVSQCSVASHEDNGYTFEGLLPRADADASKVRDVGAFVSIDARPVSTSKGTLKRIIKMFKDTLTRVNPTFCNVKEPFIHLRITCPEASYDVNVEPAKDNLLFQENDMILDIARAFFKNFYQPQEKPSGLISNKEDQCLVTQPEGGNDIPAPQISNCPTTRSEVFSPTQGIDDVSTEIGCKIGGLQALDEQSAVSQPVFRPNMYDSDAEEFESNEADRFSNPPKERKAQESVKASDVSLNPWVISKLNSPNRQSFVGSKGNESLEELLVRPPDHSIASSSPFRVIEPPEWFERPALPTPQSSPFVKTRQQFHPSQFVPNLSFAQDGRVVGPRIAPRLTNTVRKGRSVGTGIDDEPNRANFPETGTELTNVQSWPNSSSSTGTPLSAIPNISKRPRGKPRRQEHTASASKIYGPPARSQIDKETVWFDHLRDRAERPSGQRKRKHNRVDESVDLVTQEGSGEVARKDQQSDVPAGNRDIRDFTRLKYGSFREDTDVENDRFGQYLKTGTSHGGTRESRFENSTDAISGFNDRIFVPAREVSAVEARLGSCNITTATGNKRRKTGERSALQELCSNVRSSLGCESGKFGTAVGLRQRTRSRRASTGTRRVKSGHLPLERVLEEYCMHNVEYKMHASSARILQWADQLDARKWPLEWSGPLDRLESAFHSVVTDIPILASKLQHLLNDADLEIDQSDIEDFPRQLQRALILFSDCGSGGETKSPF